MLNEDTQNVHASEGRLLRDHACDLPRGLEGYLDAGGYRALARFVAESKPMDSIAVIADAGVRGRGGGGFPTAVKWQQVANSDADTRYFVCNANSGQPGGFKESFLIKANPHRILEAVAFAAASIRAKQAYIHLGGTLEDEEALLQAALNEAVSRGFLGSPAGLPDIVIRRSAGGYIAGEETAVLEALEGRPARPRGKPPMPTRAGLFGAPTAIDNIETVLQAFYAYRHGAETYREVGTRYCAGTLLFCLSGEVGRAGIYELPFGTTLRSLIFDHGGGVSGGAELKAALVGGVGGTILSAAYLDLPLDYDALQKLGGDMSGGVVFVVSERMSMVDLAIQLAAFYHDNSCGRCQPCKDGTWRTSYMLQHLDQLNQKSIDWAGVRRPSTKREIAVSLVDEQYEERTGVSYTDTGAGLDKIRLLCRWYEHRGDCHFSAEAARGILSLVDTFSSEFETRIGTPGQ